MQTDDRGRLGQVFEVFKITPYLSGVVVAVDQRQIEATTFLAVAFDVKEVIRPARRDHGVRPRRSRGHRVDADAAGFRFSLREAVPLPHAYLDVELRLERLMQGLEHGEIIGAWQLEEGERVIGEAIERLVVHL